MKAYKQLISILLVLGCVNQQAHSAAIRHQEEKAHTAADEKLAAIDFFDNLVSRFLLAITSSPHERKCLISPMTATTKTLAYLFLDKLENQKKLASLFSDSFLSLTKKKIASLFDTAEEPAYAVALAETLETLFKNLEEKEEFAYLKRLAYLRKFPHETAEEKETLELFERLTHKTAEEKEILESLKKYENAEECLRKLTDLTAEKQKFLEKLLNLVMDLARIIKEHELEEEKATYSYLTLLNSLPSYQKKDIYAEDRVVDLEEKLKPCLRSIIATKESVLEEKGL